jgi:hypothetical protein
MQLIKIYNDFPTSVSSASCQCIHLTSLPPLVCCKKYKYEIGYLINLNNQKFAAAIKNVQLRFLF